MILMNPCELYKDTIESDHLQVYAEWLFYNSRVL